MKTKSALGKYAVFSCIVIAAIALSLATAPSQRKTRLNWPTMGTEGAITFRGGKPERQDEVRAQVRATWDELEAKLSAWRAASDLSRLAPRLAAEGESALKLVSASERPCYAFAFDLKRQSRGAFDPVIGEALRRVGFKRVSPVDLGAVAKGFAVDRAWERLADTDNLLLDLGGNLRARGSAWRIGVRNPFVAGDFAAAFELRDGEAVATSGNYERFVERGGKRYSHILDPRTGKSVSGIAGVTVIAPSAMMADGLSTTLFVLGPTEGEKFLARHYPGIAALWIPDTPEHPSIIATLSMVARLIDPKFPVTVLPSPRAR